MTNFQGYCQHCDETHGLPTSEDVLEKARKRMPEVRAALGSGKGRMVGALEGLDTGGRIVTLYAYSGTTTLPGLEVGWCPTTRPTDLTQDEENTTFAQLNALTVQIEEFPVDQCTAKWETAFAVFEAEKKHMQQKRTEARKRRRALRAEFPDDQDLLERLSAESFDESTAYRRRLAELRAPVSELREQLDEMIDERLKLKTARRQLSLSLQASFMASHALSNFREDALLLEEAFLPGQGLRQGTGECAAPKLLIDAARRGLQPISIGEVWVGPPQEDPVRVEGASYGPCEERCIPLMGYLLCGLEKMPKKTSVSESVLQEGEGWVACLKPGGLLSVPGRGSEKVDSMLSRVRHLYPRGAQAEAAHRLDLETSGIQVFALNKVANGHIQTQFAKRTTEKVYLAWVANEVQRESGRIELPLQQVDRYIRGHEVNANGKAAITDFEVMKRQPGKTLLALYPRTGRTHQLRVHCASPEGLNAPIIGDSLYGTGAVGDTLFLHAWKLRFEDPTTGEEVNLEAPIPSTWSAL